MTRKETFTCSQCGTVGHWLEEFPNSLCLPCHARAVDGEEITGADIVAMFRGAVNDK